MMNTNHMLKMGVVFSRETGQTTHPLRLFPVVPTPMHHQLKNQNLLPILLLPYLYLSMTDQWLDLGAKCYYSLAICTNG